MTHTTQTDRMLELLRIRPHNGLELRTEHGIGAPNSRRSDLENRNHVVVCEHVRGVRGPAGYVYKLLVDAEWPASSLEEPDVEGTPAPSESGSSSDDRSWLHHGDREPNGGSSAEGETMAPSAEPLFVDEPLPPPADGCVLVTCGDREQRDSVGITHEVAA